MGWYYRKYFKNQVFLFIERGLQFSIKCLYFKFNYRFYFIWGKFDFLILWNYFEN